MDEERERVVVMFLAGGNKKEGVNEDQRTRGFLTVSLSDAGPA
jgi:hypothetical protein